RRNASPLAYANGRVRFEVCLQPRETWHACLLYRLADGERTFDAPPQCIADAEQSEVGRRLADSKRTVLKIRTGSVEVQRLYDQAVEDIAALRLPIEGGDHMRFVPAAGAPWFVALFGRDSLIASIQTAIVYPEFAVATLAALGSLQASERDDYRDAEPGKIMHELRLGELAHFKLIPHTPYYGTADATMHYLVALHTAWRATGDERLLERHLDTAERCLHWIDRYGDRDGDGFQEYATRSPAGYENQGWKDAGDAVVDPDGAPVEGPKAVCELQGYVYNARLRMAEIFDALGRPDRARALRAQACSLRDCFNEVFWDEASGFYAYALDGKKRKVLTVASNPGHCLWSGIVPPDRAGRVVRRLMQPDMWSGWGIRTLSADHPAYNPYSYQNGSVWPHDNAIIATGFRRYGYAAEAAEVARCVWATGGYFAQHRMPELYGGLLRRPTTFPVQYLGANVPQAWAAGSTFALLQAILGLVPDAANGRLYVDPALPGWLPEVSMTDLRLGTRRFDLRFWREGDGTRWEVSDGGKHAVVQRGYTEASRVGGCSGAETGPLRTKAAPR
ncbi:MAG: amylo-alpha-1,6-glucosidase, partial [Geminicoccaceae bacterium]